MIEDALDPDSALAYTPFDATRDQFLARLVIRFGGNWLTVRDVINQLANIEGAVHRGEAETPGNERCRKWRSSIATPACRER